MILTFVVYIFILSLLILVHEWGHFITARKCGVKVEQFAIGFGPKLWSKVWDNTEFCLCLIPLGGFVKMAGDERDKCSGRTDEYFAKPEGLRSLIILMGPVVNLMMAFFCFWVMFMVGYVNTEQLNPKALPVVGQVLEHSPAQQAGLKAGDQILSIDGKSIMHWSDLQQTITASTAQNLELIIKRDARQIDVKITPEETDQKDIFGREHKTRLIGIGQGAASAKDITVTRYSLPQAFVKAGQELWNVTVITYTALYEMAIGARSPKEAMGIVGMYFVIKYALSIGFSYVLHIVGIISASLAIFNLLPVIPLDGGHLFLIGLEKLRGRALSLKTDQFIAQAGFTLIIVLALFVFYSDFERIGLIDKIREVIHA